METQLNPKVFGIDGVRYDAESIEFRRYVERYDQAYQILHHKDVERAQAFLQCQQLLNEDLRTDANLTAFLARELVHVRGTIERTVYERLRMREFVDVEMHPRGAESYAIHRWDEAGEAKITHDLGGDDPRADVTKSEDLGKYAYARGKYGYTVHELEAAAFSGTPLPREKSLACANMIGRGVDKIGRSGNALLGMTGFFNSALVTVHTLTNGEWNLLGAGTTPDQVVADFAEIESAVIAAAKDTQPEGYRLVLPTTIEGLLSSTARATGTDLSVKEWLQKNSRLKTQIMRYGALDGAVQPDVAASDPPQGILYPKDPLTLFWPMAIVYEETAPQLSGWELVIHARARLSGVDVRQPFNMLYVQNLD